MAYPRGQFWDLYFYINDISQGLQHSKVKLYADDTVLYYSHADPNQLSYRLQYDLDVLSRWCHDNMLTINTRKTKCILFGRKGVNKVENLQKVYLGQMEVEVVNHYRYLGVILDSNMTFQQHLGNVFKLVAHKLFFLQKCRGFLTQEIALRIYKTKVLPYFDYCDVIYSGVANTLLTKLQRLQNRGLRICLKSSPRESTLRLHLYEQVPKLMYRRKCHLKNLAFKRKTLPEHVQQMRARTRRFDAPVLKTVIPKYAMVTNSTMFQTATEWNGLEVHIRKIGDYLHFKDVQRSWLRSTIGME